MPFDPDPNLLHLLKSSVLASISCRTLFYPCSGNDWELPLHLFAPEIDNFWFVDIGYFPRRSPESALRRQLLGGDLYEKLDCKVTLPDLPPEEWETDPRYRGVPPYIRTETYRHLPSGKIVTVHWHRRRGPSALRKEIDRLGVFFYRGDSDDGGSGTIWLSAATQWVSKKRKALIHEVLDKLVDGGLLVTDGSLGDDRESNPYRELHRAMSNRLRGRQAVQLVRPFDDLLGNHFECIGFAGQYYFGPTLIWRVTKQAG